MSRGERMQHEEATWHDWRQCVGTSHMSNGLFLRAQKLLFLGNSLALYLAERE
jgi:hypothetical protein